MIQQDDGHWAPLLCGGFGRRFVKTQEIGPTDFCENRPRSMKRKPSSHRSVLIVETFHAVLRFGEYPLVSSGVYGGGS
jgi:nitrate reductase NapE component